MYWHLDDGYETWQGNGPEMVQCCSFARFKIYIQVSVMIHLMQRRRYFILCIVPWGVVQLESVVPAISSRRGYSGSSTCCIKQTKPVQKVPNHVQSDT